MDSKEMFENLGYQTRKCNTKYKKTLEYHQGKQSIVFNHKKKVVYLNIYSLDVPIVKAINKQVSELSWDHNPRRKIKKYLRFIKTKSK